MLETIRELCDYLTNHMDDKITLDSIGEKYNYDKFYLLREFKMYTGFTIVEYINSIKIYKSINPLVTTNDSVLKIALNSGFNSQEYYSEMFKSILGISPLKFRKKYSLLNCEEKKDEYINKKNFLLSIKEKYVKLINMSNYVDKNQEKNKSIIKKKYIDN